MSVKFYIYPSCEEVAKKVLGSTYRENGCLDLQDHEIKESCIKLNSFIAQSKDGHEINIAYKIIDKLVEVSKIVGVDLLEPVEKVAVKAEKVVDKEN